MLWEDQDYDVSKIVGNMVNPPVGATTVYRPGNEGFLQKDLTNPAGTSPQAMPVESNPQARLAQLESRTPAGGGVLPTSPGPITIPSPATGPGEAPKYQVPGDMMNYFDDVVKTLTGSSSEAAHLKNISQGFGLIGMNPKDAAAARISATKSLADIEGLKRNAAANLAHTLSYLMTEPSKFNLNLFGKQLDYDINRRTADVASRRAGVEEMKAPWEIKKLGMTAPETTTGISPSGEKVTYAWEPESGKWRELTKGALPIGVREGENLVNPVTGETVGKGGEKSRFKENLGQVAFKSYEKELENIENDLRFQVNEGMKPDKRKQVVAAKAGAQKGAWARLQDSMKRLGYGDMFGEQGGASAIQPRQPNESIEEYLKRTGF